jgi:subtilase family serine protease
MLHKKQWIKLAGTLALASATLGLGPVALAGTPAVAPQDLGVTAPATSETVSIVLKVKNPGLLDDYIDASVDPQSPLYHRFLSVAQFSRLFAPSDADIRQVTDYLKYLGIVINEVYDNNLIIKATGTAAQFNQAFATTLHDFVDAKGRRFHKPKGGQALPARLQDIVLYVAGLDTQTAQFHPHHTRASATSAALGEAAPRVVLPAGSSTATGIPGSYTTGDVANFYGVNPLYAKGITGKGKTVGIATLADFLPSDAYFYWSQIGLTVSQTRIHQVRVDGGAELSSDAGSGETTLDVQQSGGLAPDAKIVVYDAPNTEAGFIDVFYKAVSDNLVDTLSVSWGSPEIYNFLIPGVSTDTRAVLVAYHQAFAEAAAQGISTFAATGDAGAYDTNRSLPYPQFSKILTVDSPASDPYIIAAGGTTLPGNIQRLYGVVNVPSEQVWGWDYFNDYMVKYYGSGYKDYYFSAGGGGGVSVFWPTPTYQQQVSGVRRSEPNQVWTYYPNFPDTSGPINLYTVPANVKGRNLPDVSLNADPYTGYVVYSTTDGGWLGGYGGTSFVAPQLNGIFALISQAKNSRLGLLHPQLYARKAQKPAGKSGLTDILAGDNWFYHGVKGYDPGAGLGVIDASALTDAIH